MSRHPWSTVAARLVCAIGLLAGTADSWLPTAEARQTAPFCAEGASPRLDPSFDALAVRVPSSLAGDPVECLHPENGDAIQRTSTGVFVQPGGTPGAEFRAGNLIWTLGSTGTVVQWPRDLPADFGAPFVDGPPPAVTAALPPGAQPAAAIVEFLTGPGIADPGRGVPDWVVLYSAGDGGAGGDLTVAWLSFSALGRYSVLRSIAFDGPGAVSLSTVSLGVRPATVVSAGVGPHGQRLVVVRWGDGDRRGYNVVFDGTSNTPGIDVFDADGDGTPEVVAYFSPYCESYAASPRLVTVFRWDGAAYVDDCGRYPALLAQVASDVRSAAARAGGWSAAGRACLEWSLGRLAELAGDRTSAQAHFDAARQTDPAFAGPAMSRVENRGGAVAGAGTAPTLVVGGTAVVVEAGPQRLNVRAAPAISADVVSRLADGARVRLLDGPRAGDGFRWWQVAALADRTASTGWVAEPYLRATAE